MPDRPGLYTVTYDGSDHIEKLLSVNPSPKESALVYVEAPEALQAWRLNQPAAPVRAMAGTASGQMRVSAILQQRLWWWMLMGALLTLLLEMALAATGRERA
jgi:hypothetical protein